MRIRSLTALMISIVVSNPPVFTLGTGLLERDKLLPGFYILEMLSLEMTAVIVEWKLQKQQYNKVT
ncbi:MAG: hypothetical protein JJP05_08210 [cyanobacterium endosymbiont of Rhopalodia gibba]